MILCIKHGGLGQGLNTILEYLRVCLYFEDAAYT
jgi:hypothetical protein